MALARHPLHNAGGPRDGDPEDTMPTVKLMIGNKNYSSWSLRPWLLLEHLAIPFEEVRIALYTPESRPLLERSSPSGKVPALVDGALTIWDSLAICEYVAEMERGHAAWPAAREARAVARSVAAEMHSGFATLRERMPMNVRARHRRVARTAELDADIARVQQVWQTCRERFGAGGPWLFGDFSIADAMFAPVAYRFRTYDVACAGVAADYLATLLAHPAMQRWSSAAEAEDEVVESSEVGR
jgi:glutathione S-transferase